MSQLPLREVRLKEAIGVAGSWTHVVVSGQGSVTELSLNEQSGVVSIVFRGTKKFVHLSQCKEASAADIASPAEIRKGEVRRVDVAVSDAPPEDDDDGEIDDMPDDLPPAQVVKSGAGRTRKAK